MTEAMGKRRGRKRSIRPVFLKRFLPALLAFAALLSLWMFHFNRRAEGPSSLVYEEIYFATTQLHERIRQIDAVIQESVSEVKRGEGIFYVNIQPRHQGRQVWEFSELIIQCRDEQAAGRALSTLRRGLTALGPKVRFQEKSALEGRMILHIFFQRFDTHRIILTFDTYHEIPATQRPRLAIVIDDLGYNWEMARSFMALDLPLTFSVLPSAPFTARIVREVGQRKRDLMLHFPMEPKNYPEIEPGPGAVVLSMDEGRIRRTLAKDLAQIKGVRGVNNHMGSSFTENRGKMRVVLEELKRRSLFYIDSRTTSDTVGFKLAREMGLACGKRSVFLDHDFEYRALKIQMERLLSMAKSSGAAIGIAHPHMETLKILKQYTPVMKREYDMVPVSRIVR